MNDNCFQFLFCCFAVLLLASCSTSSNQTIEPSTVSYLVKIDGLNEEATTQQDTLRVMTAGIIVENVSMGIDAGPPLTIMPGQAVVSYDKSNSDQHIELASTPIQGNTYRSSSFSVALAEDIQVSHPEYSVYVTGIVNGEEFEFGTDLTFTRGFNFSQPLVVPAQNAAIEIILSTDLRTWFRKPQGGIINPLEAESQEKIEENIEPSFELDVETGTP